jgi:hypothetical protein
MYSPRAQKLTSVLVLVLVQPQQPLTVLVELSNQQELARQKLLLS